MNFFQFTLSFMLLTNQCYGMSELLKAIELQDAKTLERELKGKFLTHQEEYELIAKARQLIKEHNKKAWLSPKYKKSILATGCLVFMGVGLACLGNILVPLGLLSDTKPRQEVSFFKEVSRELDHPGTKRWLALNLLGGLVGIAGGIFSGRECLTGYYTDRPTIILNLINEHITPYSVVTLGDEEFIYFDTKK